MSRLSSHIATFENQAREKYNTALGRIHYDKPTNWFQSILNRTILPPLREIGFDSQLSRTLFQIAIHSWQEMGSSVDDCLWIHPSLTNSIEEIRNSVLRRAEKKALIEKRMARMSSREIHDHFRKSMAPENLTSLLDEIATSWVILPRAHSLLRKNDGCCLISYLKYLKREKNPDFKRIIARIVTEFIGNYSLKFASENQSERAVNEVIFYGYAMMFWQNLAKPPTGCEELAIYRNFLDWAKSFLKKTNFITDDKIEAVNDMVAMEKTLFPSEPITPESYRGEIASEKFLLTLRHGKRGLEATCNSFGLAGNKLQSIGLDQPLIPSSVKALTGLIREVEIEKTNETRKTKQTILQFMQRLRDTYYRGLTDNLSVAQRGLPDQLEFASQRLVSIINKFIGQFSLKEHHL